MTKHTIDPSESTLPVVPITSSPVPHLSALCRRPHAIDCRRPTVRSTGTKRLIRDLLAFYRPAIVMEPVAESGVCRDVCLELGIHYRTSDQHHRVGASGPTAIPRESFEFCWLYAPDWSESLVTTDPRAMSRPPTPEEFLERYRQLIANCVASLAEDGRLAILIGDHHDPESGFVPMVYEAMRFAFDAGLRRCCKDIVRFSTGSVSAQTIHRAAYLTGADEVCMVFEKSKL